MNNPADAVVSDEAAVEPTENERSRALFTKAVDKAFARMPKRYQKAYWMLVLVKAPVNQVVALMKSDPKTLARYKREASKLIVKYTNEELELMGVELNDEDVKQFLHSAPEAEQS